MNNKIISSLVVLAIIGGSGWKLWANQHKEPAAEAKEASSTGAGGKRGPRGAGNRPTPVLAATVKKSDLRIVQTAVGTVTPSAVVTVRSRVNGQLVRVLFKEGQSVRAGELLAEIDQRPFQAQLTQVQGQALHNQALLKNSQLDLDRYKTLQSQDSIASQQVDAQASLVQQYQGTVQADQGLVDNAKLQLSFTRITSPINGRIGLRQVDVGNNITTTDALAVVNTVDPIQVVFTLPEDRVSNLVKRLQEARKSGGGLPVEAWDKGNANLLAKGTLQSLDNQIDTTSGTIKLKAQLSNNEGLLFPNQFVNIRLLSDTLRDITVVPSAAIQHGSAGAFVYLITNDDKKGGDHGATNKPASDQFSNDRIPGGKVASDKEPGDKGSAEKVVVQPVTTGAVDGDLVAIENGVQPGDRVVVSGIDKLRDGAKVIVSTEKEGRDGGGRRSGKRGNGKEKSPAETLATDGAKENRRHRQDDASAVSQNPDSSPSTAAPAEEGTPRRHRGDRAGNQGDGTPREGGWKRHLAGQADGAPPVPAASSSQ